MPKIDELYYKTIPLAFTMKGMDEPEDDDYDVKGYITTFGNQDKQGDIIEPTALDGWLKGYEENGMRQSNELMNGKALPMLMEHIKSDVVGYFKRFEKEDAGLMGYAKFYNTTRAMDVKNILKDSNNVYGGFSIGFRAKKDMTEEILDKKTDKFMGYKFKEIVLTETSLVLNPANSKAQITGVKSVLREDGSIHLREVERILRESGLSKSQAEALVTNCKSFLQQSPQVTHEEALAQLKKFNAEQAQINLLKKAFNYV